MKISATETAHADTALVFLDEEGAAARWLLFESGSVILRGEFGEPLPMPANVVVAVPGEKVAIHWLELADSLAPAQAAAAARLLLADVSAEPIAQLHVAVGLAEGGRTPVALVANRQMVLWLASAAQAGIDPAVIVPTPVLLAPPAEGFVRLDRGNLSDYRGVGSAFTLEPGLAEHLVTGAAEPVSVERFEAELGSILAHPPLNLRQGPFAVRRAWWAEGGRLRRLVALALAFALLTLALQVVMILRYTFAADSLEAEAQAVAQSQGDARPGFSDLVGVLFNGVQATPNVEITLLRYRPGGTLMAAVVADSPASLDALVDRVRASGLQVESAVPRSSGGRQAADLVIRP